MELNENTLKSEYGFNEKGDDSYFNLAWDGNNKKEIERKFNVYINPKKNSNSIKVSGKDRENRINAIIEIIESTKKEEEDFLDDDDDSLDLIKNFGQTPEKPKPAPQKNTIQNQAPPQSQHQEQNNNNNNNSPEPENKDQNNGQKHRDNGSGRRYIKKDRNDRNDKDRQYRNQKPYRYASNTPNNNQQQQQPNQIQRNNSSGPRKPTENYSRLQRNRNNEKNPENQDQTDKENLNERNPSYGDGRRGRGDRWRRGGRGRGRGRGRFRGERAPLAPRKSTFDEEDGQISQEPINNEVNDGQQRHRGNGKYNNYRYNNYRRGGNRYQGDRRYPNGPFQQPPKPQPGQMPEQQEQIQDQPPIPPENIAFKGDIEITPELRHILMLMENTITPELPESEILEIKWFELEKLRDPLDESLMKPEKLMNAPYLLVEFLIESFAVDQPEQFHRIEHKEFPEKQLIHLEMPFKMPMTFQTDRDRDKIQIGFYDFPNFSSNDMNQLCSQVLTTLSQRNMLVLTINEVDQGFSFQQLEDLSRELDFVYLRSIPDKNEEMETISFTIKIMIYNWSQEKEERIKERIQQIVADFSIYECKKCYCTYCPSDGSKCYKTYHKGKQIPFPDTGEMEMVDEDDNGEPVTLVNYTCCGEIEIDAPGCVTSEIENGPHEPFDETNSSMSVDILPIYS